MKNVFLNIAPSIMAFSLLLFVWGNAALSEEVPTQPSPAFAGQWPYHSCKAIVMDETRGLIFEGDGDRLEILGMDLHMVSSMTVTQSGLVSALFYDAQKDLLYIACKNNGLWIVDVSDPGNPFKTGAYFPDASTTEVNGVFVDGNRAYLAGGVDGLLILDVSAPSDPAFISQSRLPGGFGISYAVDVMTLGNYGYVADLYTGIHIVDVTDPSKPSYKKGIALPGAHDLDLSGNYLYATLEGNGMAITNITTPIEPHVDSLYAPDGVETAVRVADNFAYIGYGVDGLRVVDVSDSTKPVRNTAWTYTASGCTSISLVPDAATLYLTNEQVGLEKLDISDKTAIHSLLSHDTPADAVAVDIAGDYAVTVDDIAGNAPETEGLRIIQISPFKESVQLYLKGFCATPGRASDVKITGDFAVVTDGEMGIEVIDMTDKTAPTIAGSCDTPGVATGVTVSGNYAFVADGDSGMAVVDISDKGSPVLAASMDTPGTARQIAVSGNYAFIADGEAGLQVIDITNKNGPVLIGACDTTGTASGVTLSGNYAFVADGESGMAVMDITDKTAPSLVAYVDTPGTACHISIIGNYAYVADGKKGVSVIDVTNPLLPVRNADLSYDSNGFASDLSGGYTSENEALFTFIADGPAGLVALNLLKEPTDDTVDAGGSGGGCFIGAAGR